MSTEEKAIQIAKKFGFLEGTQNYNVAIRIFCEGAEFGSSLSLPLKEEQKSVTDKDLFYKMGHFYFSLKDAKGDKECEKVYRKYAKQLRSLFGEKGKEKKDE